MIAGESERERERERKRESEREREREGEGEREQSGGTESLPSKASKSTWLQGQVVEREGKGGAGWELGKGRRIHFAEMVLACRARARGEGSERKRRGEGREGGGSKREGGRARLVCGQASEEQTASGHQWSYL